MASSLSSAYELKCSCNSYPWGKQGAESLAARLCERQPGWDGKGPQTDFKMHDSRDYAEMWMGTYPVLPSYIATTSEDLQDVINRHPKELIGEKMTKTFGHSKLPYLPKVLSIAKALPLQVHPDKFYQEKSDAFIDPNHKPAIAIALSKFEAFCGFKPLESINELMEINAFKRFLPNDKPDLEDQDLKGVVRSMLAADDDTVKEVYQGIIAIPSDQYEMMANASDIPSLAERLADMYDGAHPGILVALVTMNYLLLQPGDSIYIPADGIHAYIQGDIIEGMARSNNMLVTGICLKAERSNIDTFCACLTISRHSAEENISRPSMYAKSETGETWVVAPPSSEFNVLEAKLDNGKKEVLEASKGLSVLIATQGSADLRANDEMYQLKDGHVFFVAQGVRLEFDASSEGLHMFTAVVG